MLDQGPTSLFLFTPSSPLRRLATWICNSKAFETIITCTIILNCVTMMLDEKLGNGDRAILSGQLVRKDEFDFEFILRLFQDSQREITQPCGLGRAVIWRRGFVNNFLRVPLAFLGSRTAAVQLWNSQKIVYKKSSPTNSPAW